MVGAPALSSFAPRPPLGVSPGNSKSANTAIAKAAATITVDGSVLSISKQAAFVRDGNRYSAFVRKIAVHPAAM